MTNNTWEKFPEDTIELLFTAVEEDDNVDEHTSLPGVIDLRCPHENIYQNYALCLQFWRDGFTREELLGLVEKFIKNPDLPQAVRMRYKYIRARYKHLRFAQRLYSKKHQSFGLFNTTTVVLGHFQDAFRNGNQKNLKYYGAILRILLSKPIWSLVSYAMSHFELETESGFIAYRQSQIRTLGTLINHPQLTGEEFHDVRKIVSQQVSFYDTLRSINPGNQQAYEMSRFLAAINGIMGDQHDVMVADKLSGGSMYDEATALEPDLRLRLEQLLAHYPQ
ncbi:hypothetical protein DT73_17015 [Mangrovibacter sp. MFB070]|uniref:hypothetical protein n=1 Tax=Mangrovibacter sp. MFB070 TaxID=1224318 RepID=UPI0004D69CB2|nr:hypothetical protein [Mangrovibacter sp. MFB070]KEA51606.1 hypothetical protein DT73_17015 [Mangrovibacter sp. MFB070]